MRKELPVGGFPTTKPLDPKGKYGLHMYHATLPPRIAHTAEEERENRREGFGTEYIPQEFPKHVTRPDGVVVNVLNADEEAVAMGAKPEPETPHKKKGK